MWRVRNESTGKEVLYYEAEVIEKITARCKNKVDLFKREKSDYNFGVAIMANNILDIIERYEKEDS